MPPDPGERYVYASVMQTMVRAIYHIIPDPAWPEVERNLRTFPVFRYANGIFRLTVFDGVPLYITRAATMPHVGEKVLLHIGNRTWDDRNFSGILRLLKDRTLTSDIITIAGDAPAGRLEALQAYAHDR
jgi:hypothetical protein